MQFISKKTGILLTLFMVPVFIIFMFTILGKSHHRLPVFFAYDSIQVDGEYKVTDAQTIPDFKFINYNLDTIRGRQFSNKIRVFDFVFTTCGGICPQMTKQLSRAQEFVRNDSNVVFISFTVDPAYDSPQVLAKYAQKYEAMPNWYFLTGSKDSIYHLGQNAFYLTTKQNEKDPLDFLHSNKLILVDQNGWIRGYYNGTEEKEVDRLVTEIKVLQHISKENK
jgi:protein SCO1/2